MEQQLLAVLVEIHFSEIEACPRPRSRADGQTIQ